MSDSQEGLRLPMGDILCVLREVLVVAEASGRLVSLSADNIRDVLEEMQDRDDRIDELHGLLKLVQEDPGNGLHPELRDDIERSVGVAK